MGKENVVYIYVYILLLLGHKKNEIMPFVVTCMDLEVIILSEVSQAEKTDIYYQLYGEPEKQHR